MECRSGDHAQSTCSFGLRLSHVGRPTMSEGCLVRFNEAPAAKLVYKHSLYSCNRPDTVSKTGVSPNTRCEN